MPHTAVYWYIDTSSPVPGLTSGVYTRSMIPGRRCRDGGRPGGVPRVRPGLAIFIMLSMGGILPQFVNRGLYSHFFAPEIRTMFF